MDTNHDGFISKSEAKESNSLYHSFDQPDTDKDGKLSMREYQAIIDEGVGSSGAGGGVNKSLPSRGADSSSGSESSNSGASSKNPQ